MLIRSVQGPIVKVLFCIRPDYRTRFGGDSVQMLTAYQYLTERGVDVCIIDRSIKNFSEFDMIHLFNLTRITETYQYFKLAQKSGRPVVLTPIYWDLKKYYSYSENHAYLELWNANAPYRQEILYGCDMIYPSSMAEQSLIKQEAGTDIPCTLVYNCINLPLETTGEAAAPAAYPFIFCAARICPRKNQYVLAKICRELDQPLILAGGAYNRDYLEQCLQFDHVRYLGFLKGIMLIKMYQAAKLHVLCSFLETPGLSSMEAGACGTPIVSTQEGSAREYFGDLALYCNPYHEADIYNAVKKGLAYNPQPLLKEHLLKHYNTQTCLEPLYKSYCDILN